MNKLIYKDLTFLGREFKSKGTAKTGREWKLFSCKFRDINQDLKFTAFGNPNKGLSIEDLKEGETYNIGYNTEDKTFTNDQKEEITYEQRTVAFISELKDTNTPQLPTPVTPQPQTTSTDLLATPTEEVVLNTPVIDIKLNPEEETLLNQLKALDQTKVIEQTFKETCANRLANCGDNRQDELWRLYAEKRTD